MSLVLLQSEKQITPSLKDSSDEPDNFVNIFRKPIKIKPNQTVELVSFGFNKNATIVMTANNNVMYYRIGSFDNYTTTKVVVKIGTYTISEFVTELENKLNASMNLNQYSFTVSYNVSTDSVTINLLQESTPTLFNSSTAFGEVQPRTSDYSSSFSEETDASGNKLYLSNITSGLASPDLDQVENLSIISSSGTPLFSNNGGFMIELRAQYHIEGITTTPSLPPVTMTDNSANTGNWTNYSGSNGYAFQFTVDGTDYYVKLVGGTGYSANIYTGDLKDNSGNHIKWNDRGKYWIVSQSDDPIPAEINNTVSGFSLVKMLYSTSNIASLKFGSLTFNTGVTELETEYGSSDFTSWTMTNITNYLFFQRRGFKNGVVGINTFKGVPPHTPDTDYIDIENDLLRINADYSIGLETTQISTNSPNVSVKLKAYRTVNGTLKNADLTVGGTNYTSGVDLHTVGSIAVNGAMTNDIRLIIRLQGGAASGTVQTFVESAAPGTYNYSNVSALEGTFTDVGSNKFKQASYPLYGVVAMSSGSYGQNMGSFNPFKCGGYLSTKSDNTVTGESLRLLGITNVDYEDSLVDENVLGATQQLSYFFRFKVVPDSDISQNNSAGSDLTKIDKRDVEYPSGTNATKNDASLGDDLNFNPFYRQNSNSSATATIIGNSGLKTSYVAENINITLPDFPIVGYNGVIGQPQALISSVASEQIETDQQTGRLYHQAKIPNRIKLNNINEEEINHIRVKLTTPEGTQLSQLLHPTTVLIKINE